MSLNHIVLMGRLTRDPELRHTQTGTPVCAFTLAVDRDVKDKATGERATDFIDIVAWRQTAEFAARYLAKGRMTAAEGRLQLRDWTDQDGNRRRAAEVIAEHLYFCDSRPNADSGPGTGERAGTEAGAPTWGTPDEDLPF